MDRAKVVWLARWSTMVAACTAAVSLAPAAVFTVSNLNEAICAVDARSFAGPRRPAGGDCPH